MHKLDSLFARPIIKLLRNSTSVILVGKYVELHPTGYVTSRKKRTNNDNITGTGHQVVSLRSFPLDRSAVPVGQPYLFITTF